MCRGKPPRRHTAGPGPPSFHSTVGGPALRGSPAVQRGDGSLTGEPPVGLRVASRTPAKPDSGRSGKAAADAPRPGGVSGTPSNGS